MSLLSSPTAKSLFFSKYRARSPLKVKAVAVIQPGNAPSPACTTRKTCRVVRVRPVESLETKPPQPLASRPLKIPRVCLLPPSEMGRCYHRVRELGSGSYGQALLVNWTESSDMNPLLGEGVHRAVFKCMRSDLPADKHPKVMHDFASEAIILHQLAGIKGVPKLYCLAALSSKPSPILVQEYVPGPILIDFINRVLLRRPRSFRRRFFWNFACALLEVVAALHRRGIVHCDLKADNIILCNRSGKGPDSLVYSPEVYVIDYGLACMANPANYDTSSISNLPKSFVLWGWSQEKLDTEAPDYDRFPTKDLVCNIMGRYSRASEHIAPEISYGALRNWDDAYLQDAFSIGMVLDQVLNLRQHPYTSSPPYMGRPTMGQTYESRQATTKPFRPISPTLSAAEKADPKLMNEERDADTLLLFLTQYRYQHRWGVEQALDYIKSRSHYLTDPC